LIINEQPVRFVEEGRVCTLVFPSSMALVEAAVQDVKLFVARHLGAAAAEPGTSLAVVLREMLINAVEHGNFNRYSRRVQCRVEVLADGLVAMAVEDEGDGFDWRRLDLSLPPDPRQVRKRGLPLISAYSRHLTFNAKGNRVEAVVQLAPAAACQTERTAAGVVIHLAGMLGAAMADSLRNCLVQALAGDATGYCLDFHAVREVDSVGLSVLIGFARTLAQRGRRDRPAIVNLAPDLDALFRLTRMDLLYDLRPPAHPAPAGGPEAQT